MTPRLESGLLVNALVRRVNAAGGSAAVLARGDQGAGAILIVTFDGDAGAQAWERGWDDAGRSALVATGPAEGEEAAVTAYWQRRRERDSDLWVVELIVPEAKRFAAETLCDD